MQHSVLLWQEFQITTQMHEFDSCTPRTTAAGMLVSSSEQNQAVKFRANSLWTFQVMIRAWAEEVDAIA